MYVQVERSKIVDTEFFRCFYLPATLITKVASVLNPITAMPKPHYLCSPGDFIQIDSHVFIHIQKIRDDQVSIYVQAYPHARVQHLDEGQIELLKNALKDAAQQRRRVDELWPEYNFGTRRN